MLQTVQFTIKQDVLFTIRENKKLFWQAYTWPKLFVPPRRPDVTKVISVGRRFGKVGLTYHSIVESLQVSDKKKKELHELYEKELRGEE